MKGGKGGRANGAACGTNEQCTSGYCAQGDAACGVCATFIRAGSTCVLDDDCEPGLICGKDAHCVVPGNAGTTCSDTQPCRYGYYCRNGSCVTAATEPGATCTDPGSCELERGIFCNTAVQTCQKIGFVGPGEACGLIGSGFTLCANGKCIFATVNDTQGLCAAQGKDGDPCNAAVANDHGCQAPARCISGRCKLPNSGACN